jgi:hypothetical protein
MDQALQTMLMERLAAAGEQASGDDADLSALISSQFPDPLMGALVTLLNRRNQAAAEEGSDDPHANCRVELSRARQAVHTLRQLLEPAGEITRYVADVFGACPSCWGLEPACEQCHGRGRAGWSEPSSEDLFSWVEPALGRLGLRIVQVEGLEDDGQTGRDRSERREP